MDEKKPKWHLRFCGRPDTPVFRASLEHLRVFPLWKDSEAHLISRDEYLELVKAGEIDNPQSCWSVGKNEVGVISLSCYKTFTKTWEAISTANGDFESGWRACMEYMEIAIKNANKTTLKRFKKLTTHRKTLAGLETAVADPVESWKLKDLLYTEARRRTTTS